LAERHLHIVSFDVPAPPSYGGVIDVYHKAKALAALGMQVHLHCFQYGRPVARELEAFCASVHYYPRHTGKLQLLNSLPYVVVGRRSEHLVERLLADEHPILFEGLHCCFHLGDPRLHGRRRLVRTHNVEHHYYAALAEATGNPFRRGYFRSEARKLERYEPVLAEADAILAISPQDEVYFKAHFRNVLQVPAFHASERVEVPSGLGTFALYHGALGVPENDRAALWLLREVFPGLPVKLVIAGSDPGDDLRREAARLPNVELRTDIPTAEVQRLVREAQVNVLPTFQATGIKLKLLHCLFSGRHVVCNTPMVQGTGLERLCHVHDQPAALRASILACMARPVDGEAHEDRVRVLEERFSNSRNAERIVNLLG
jgi:hypothetical protein